MRVFEFEMYFESNFTLESNQFRESFQNHM